MDLGFSCRDSFHGCFGLLSHDPWCRRTETESITKLYHFILILFIGFCILVLQIIMNIVSTHIAN